MSFLTLMEKIIAYSPRDLSLDRPLLDWGDGNKWTVRDSFEGTMVFGSTGSGKTSGSAAKIFEALLRAGYGGLVLSVKDEERDNWIRLAKAANRAQDILLFSVGGNSCYNPLEGETNVINAVQLIFTLVELMHKAEAKEDQSFWRNEMLKMLRNPAELSLAAYGEINLPRMEAIIQSFPRTLIDAESATWKNTSACWQALELAQPNPYGLSLHNLKRCRNYFLQELPTAAEKTRANVVSSATGVLDQLLRDPLQSMFCGRTTISPSMAVQDGKIILIDVPLMEDDNMGKLANMIWKFCFQRIVQRAGGRARKVFLASDEAQYFLNEEDAKFQTIARGMKCASVYLTQSLPNLYGRLGHDFTHVLLPGLKTQIFHQNACIETNKYASELIGQRWVTKVSEGSSQSWGGASSHSNQNQSENRTRVREPWLQPEDFALLKTGGPENDFQVEGIVFKPGKRFRNNRPYYRATFGQQKPRATPGH
jgi:type IV secretory pathway TraG/TraD family ATPase VirD4